MTDLYGVSADLVQLASEASLRHARKGGTWDPDDYRAFLLAAVLPACKTAVRAEVAKELQADAAHHRHLAARSASNIEAHQACAKALDEAAARITKEIT